MSSPRWYTSSPLLAHGVLYERRHMKHPNTINGCYVICNHCTRCHDFPIDGMLSGMGWCWRMFRIVDRIDGCKHFRCRCRKDRHVEVAK